MNWNINITDFLGGFSPRYYENGYPSYGNKNQAGAMLNANLINPNGLTQGPGLSTLTNGTQAGAVTTLIRSILDLAVTTNVTYGVGGAKLYKITPGTVTNTGIWPHAIDKAAVTSEDGEDVVLYKGNLYYSYNHSGSAGDIGKYDLDTTFDDDWGSTTPTGAAALTGGVPHQMKRGTLDSLYIANGRYLATYDGTTFDPQALDLYTDSVIQSIAALSDKIYVAANSPNVGGTNKNTASIFIWDGLADSFETEIKLMGAVGALHEKNGTMFVFYQDVSNIGGYKLAYLNGTAVVDICNFSGGLPKYYQVTDYKDFIIWNVTSLNSLWSYTSFPWQMVSPWTTTTGDDLIYAFGSGDKDLPARFFQLADSGYTTAGAISAPFGTPMVASFESSSYKLAQFSGYDVNSNWKSLMFDVTGDGSYSRIKFVKINFGQISTGARVDWTLRNNKGIAVYSDTISYDKLGAATSVSYPLNGPITENLRVEFDYIHGSTSNTVKIKSVKIRGTTE
jgi:hypothetical protein